MPAEVGSKVKTKAPNGEVREGEVILYDPDDDELTYKVKFADGPPDWFKRRCVALPAEDFPPEPVPKAAAETEADKIEFSTAAPYLAEFYRKSAAFGAKTVEHGSLLAMALNPHAQKKLKDDNQAWYQSEGKPLIEKSFHLHDSKKTGVLDKYEAAVFCEHLFSAEAAFNKYIAARQLQMIIQSRMGWMLSNKNKNRVPPEKREELKAEIETEIAKGVQFTNAHIQAREDAYLANKDVLNAAAFKVLDTSGDGSIQLTELVAAFEPDSAKNLEFHVALGFTSLEEAKTAPGAQECAQQ